MPENKQKDRSKGNKSAYKKAKRRAKKFSRFIGSRVLGSDHEKYNTVGSASVLVCNNFKVMQLIRGLLLLGSFILFILYGYIYVSGAFTMYGFYAIATTFFAFLFLFLGSGKQVVYQKLVDSGKRDYN